ncbi:threonine-phosphate decarboxylase [Bacillus ectoiniformans]|uniref:threonine-phosphate decarboxylase CobD n=1 Tax=Bacillus ectoiniformans TaxID=1494429 RepID=UPI00195B0918|nr:threonine-phosphate decarboxylase CobD [Bacillus ectoiniformans]MBM7649553.1 threonine-phosphate decarboxylase [Bacillus ectoiniformans]
MNLPAHGSNPAALYQSLHLSKPERMIDFSVNTNPLGTPSSIKNEWSFWLSLAEDYPDPEGASLKRLLAEKNGVNVDQIVLGNGAAEIIQFLGQYLRNKRAVIVQPAFAEYEAACQTYGCETQYVHVSIDNWELPIDEIVEQASQIQAVFICSPNNPTGLSFQSKQLIELCHQLKTRQTLVVIDEAFYDFADRGSLTSYLTDYPNLILLRSLTKMYAIAGLRIGYMLASKEITAEISRFLPHWNVNAVALQAAETALKDLDYVKHSRQMIQEERRQMYEFFTEQGFEYTRSEVNYYLMRDPEIEDQEPLFLFLLKKGIVLRHTYNYPGLEGRWLRAAVKLKAENNCLKEALSLWKQQRN